MYTLATVNAAGNVVKLGSSGSAGYDHGVKSDKWGTTCPQRAGSEVMGWSLGFWSAGMVDVCEGGGRLHGDDSVDKANPVQSNAGRSDGGRPLFSLRFKIAAAAGFSVFAFVLAELLLRAFGIGYPSFYQPDDLLGIALRPGAEGWYGAEGGSYIRVNTAGMRDRDHALAKPANTLRIAVLGDSYAEAKQVAIDDTFWSILERELPKRCDLNGRAVEVLNFGCAGYGTAQELLLLGERVWDYHPDVVLLAFCVGNDVTDSVRSLKKVDYVPYFVYRDGALVVDDTFRESAAYRSRRGLAARAVMSVLPYSRIVQVVNRIRYTRRAAARRGRDRGGLVDGMADQDVGIYLRPRMEPWVGAWKVTEGMLALMNEESRSRGARFLLVSISTPIQAHPDAGVRERFERELGVEHLFYVDGRLAEIGRREHFGVLTLGRPFQLYAEERQTYLHGFGERLGRGHWNEAGHRLAAGMIADWMCDRLQAE